MYHPGGTFERGCIGSDEHQASPTENRSRAGVAPRGPGPTVELSPEGLLLGERANISARVPS